MPIPLCFNLGYSEAGSINMHHSTPSPLVERSARSSDDTFTIMDDSNDDAELTLASSSTFTLGSTFTLASAAASHMTGARGSLRRSVSSHQLLLARQIQALSQRGGVGGSNPASLAAAGAGSMIEQQRRSRDPLTPPKLPKTTVSSPPDAVNPATAGLSSPVKLFGAGVSPSPKTRGVRISDHQQASDALVDSSTFTLASATFSLAATTMSMTGVRSTERGPTAAKCAPNSGGASSPVEAPSPSTSASFDKQRVQQQNVLDVSMFTVASATVASSKDGAALAASVVINLDAASEDHALQNSESRRHPSGDASSRAAPVDGAALAASGSCGAPSLMGAAALHESESYSPQAEDSVVSQSPLGNNAPQKQSGIVALLVAEQSDKSSSLLTCETSAPMGLASPTKLAVKTAGGEDEGHEVFGPTVAGAFPSTSSDASARPAQTESVGDDAGQSETNAPSHCEGVVPEQVVPEDVVPTATVASDSHPVTPDILSPNMERQETAPPLPNNPLPSPPLADAHDTAAPPPSAGEHHGTSTVAGRRDTIPFSRHLSSAAQTASQTASSTTSATEAHPHADTTSSSSPFVDAAEGVLSQKGSQVVLTRLPSALSSQNSTHEGGASHPVAELAVELLVKSGPPVRRSSVPWAAVSGSSSSPQDAVCPPSVLVTASSFRAGLPLVLSPSPPDGEGHSVATLNINHNSISASAVSVPDKSVFVEKPATQAFLDAVSKISQRSPTSSQSDGGAFLSHSPMMMSSRKRSVVFEEQENPLADMPSGPTSFEIPMAVSMEPSPDSIPLPGTGTGSRTPSGDANPTPSDAPHVGAKMTTLPIRLPSYASLGGVRSQRGDETHRQHSPSMVALSLSYESADAVGRARHRQSLSDTLATNASGDPNEESGLDIAGLQRALAPPPVPASGKTSPHYQQLQDFLSPKQRHQNFQYGDVDPLSSGTHASSTFLGASRPGLVLAGFGLAGPTSPINIQSTSQSLLGDIQMFNDKLPHRKVSSECLDEQNMVGSPLIDEDVGAAVRAALLEEELPEPTKNRRSTVAAASASAFLVSADGAMVSFATVPVPAPDEIHEMADAASDDDLGAILATQPATPPHDSTKTVVPVEVEATGTVEATDDADVATDLDPVLVLEFEQSEVASRHQIATDECLLSASCQWLFEWHLCVLRDFTSDQTVLLGEFAHIQGCLLLAEEHEKRSVLVQSADDVILYELWPQDILSRASLMHTTALELLCAVSAAWRHIALTVDDEARGWKSLTLAIASDASFSLQEQTELTHREGRDRQFLGQFAALEISAVLNRHTLMQQEDRTRATQYFEADSELVAGYTAAQESAIRRHILLEYLSGRERLQRVHIVREESWVTAGNYVGHRGESHQRAAILTDERTQRTELHMRYVAVVAVTPEETLQRCCFEDAALQRLRYLCVCATPKLALLELQATSRQELSFHGALLRIAMLESFYREQMELRWNWLHASVSRTNAVLIHYLYRAIPCWAALPMPANVLQGTSGAGYRPLLAQQARQWGTCFTDVWVVASGGLDHSTSVRQRRLVYIRHAGHDWCRGVKQSSILTQKLWEAQGCRNRGRVATSKAVGRHRPGKSTARHLMVPRAQGWVVKLPLRRIRSHNRAQRVCHWVRHCPQSAAPACREPTLFIRDETLPFWWMNLDSRTARRASTLALKRNKNDTQLNEAQYYRRSPEKSRSPVFVDEDTSPSPSLHPVSDRAPSFASLSPSLARSSHSAGQAGKKPILCCQSFARARLSSLYVALLKSRRVSKYAATLRSMVTQYDYLSGYANALQNAVEGIVRGVPQRHPTRDVTAARPMTADASRHRAPPSRPPPTTSLVDVDRLYQDSVYFKKDASLLPSTRRPFSAGKVRPQLSHTLQEYLDADAVAPRSAFARRDSATSRPSPQSSRPQSASVQRPGSAQSQRPAFQQPGRQQAIPNGRIADIRVDPQDDPVDRALRADAVDAAVGHWAAMRRERLHSYRRQ